MNAIIVRHIRLPYKIDGLTSVDDDGDYNVYINTEVGEEKQESALNHELSHIAQDHFFDDKPLQVDEREADNDTQSSRLLLPCVQWG
jgi:Zn-dependent peptidase ImmA (M78 family)